MMVQSPDRGAGAPPTIIQRLVSGHRTSGGGTGQGVTVPPCNTLKFASLEIELK
jgi:hypothetical protein